MQNNISSTNFSSGIYFIPHNRLLKMAETPGVKTVYESNGIQGIETIKDKGFTQGIMFCLGGVLKKTTKNNKGKNEEKVTMAHLYPTQTIPNFSTIKKSVEQFLSNDKFKGIIVGGEHWNIRRDGLSRDNYGDKSSTLLSKLRNVFKPFKNKDFTIFYGQKIKDEKLGLTTAFLFDKKADKYFISIDTDNLKNANKIFSPEEIKDYFHYKHVSKNDQVFVVDPEYPDNYTKVPNSFFNKS